MTPQPVPLALGARQLAAIVRATHGIDVRAVHPLGGEYASNARLDIELGPRMCKVFAVPEAHAAEFAAQQRWRGALADRLALAGLPVARTIEALDGEGVATIGSADARLLADADADADADGDGDGEADADGDGENDAAEPLALVVQLSEWLEGTPWSLAARGLDSDELAALRVELGAVAARVVAALAGAEHPSRSPAHLWGFETMAEVATAHLDRVGATLPASDAAAARTLIRRFTELGELGDLPSGVTHHDLHDDNLLLASDADGRLHVSGIIDFDDARVAPLVAELAIAAAYACRGAEDPVSGIVDVVAGYCTQRELSPRELDALAAGAPARLALNAAVWSARAAEGTTRDYAAARLGGTWPAVRALAALRDGELRGRLDEA